MCILCVVQRWSRRVATMLPWLVLPLILLWAISQLLPPGYRFEVTSPRLACVFVLLLTLFWYEILLPQLSLWRARRSARLREERRAHALELQKLRKTATRRCRNCHNPYRDQNPGGGRFMCSYCGHISKRPVLDIPMSMSPVAKNSGWVCNQDWVAGDVNGSWPGARYWIDDRCSTDKSYTGFFTSSWEFIFCFISRVLWFCSKVFTFKSREDRLSDSGHKRSSKRGENGGNLLESRVERARRKAEEKRLARLEKEMLEEEERKQREEVARLVEERRKLRDEKREAEARSKGVTALGDRESRKEAERRRQERRKEKDKGSSKSNSDCEDLDRVANKEIEKKREFDKRSEPEKHDHQKWTPESYKSITTEANRGSKFPSSKSKYFGRVTGSFLSSSRGFTSGSFFGRSGSSVHSANKPTNKATAGVADQSTTKRETGSALNVVPKPALQPVNSQPRPSAWKKPWHHLFTRSSLVAPCPENNENYIPSWETNVLSGQYGLQSNSVGQLPGQRGLNQLPFVAYPPPTGPVSSISFPHVCPGPVVFPEVRELKTVEEDHFEDSSNDPNAIALLGPVSESLNCFPADVSPSTPSFSSKVGCSSTDVPYGSTNLSSFHGVDYSLPVNDCYSDAYSDILSANVVKELCVSKTLSTPGEVSRPSPIESPLSRTRLHEEKSQIKTVNLSSTSKADGFYDCNMLDSANEQGTWQMWSAPVVPDNLQLGGNPGWSAHDESTHNQDRIFMGVPPPYHTYVVDQQNAGKFSPLTTGLMENDMWLPKTPHHSLPADGESFFSLINPSSFAAYKESVSGSSVKSLGVQPFEMSPTYDWCKEEAAAPTGPEEATSPCAHNGLQNGRGSFLSANPPPEIEPALLCDANQT